MADRLRRPRFNRREALTLGLSLAAVPALSACSGSEPAQAGDELVLEFPSWQAEDGTFSPWWKELIAEYEKTHPGVRVDFYPLPFDSYIDQLTIRFAAGDRPEIVHLPARNAAEFAGRGWLSSLQSRMEKTDILRTWTPLQDEMATDDVNYGLLLLGYGYNLYVNKQLLAQVGAGIPTTPEEMIRTAEAITGDGVYGFGATTAQNPDNYTELAAFVVGNGGTFSTEDGTITTETEAVLAGMDQYRRALVQSPQGIQTQQRNELFLGGKIAMLLDGPFFLPELDSADDDLRPHLEPVRPPFAHVPGGVSNSLHMSADLDRRTADAVWDLIALAATPHWQRRYTEMTANPAPRRGSLTADAVADVPQLSLFQKLADDAVSIFPSAQEQREQFGRISDVVSGTATTLITTDESTDAIAAELGTALEDALETS